MDPRIFNASHTGSKQSVISLHKKFYRTVPMIEFSMTNHSADPNQRYLARIRKLIQFYGTDPENAQKLQKSK